MAAENRGTPRFELSYAVFRSVLQGVALSPDELARRTSMDETEALDLINVMVDEGRLRLDDQQRIIAAGGLSLDDSRHAVTINGRRLGVWCAMDAVGIPAGLNADATVESECVDTGEPVRIEIRHGHVVDQSPPDLFISLVPASVATSVFDTL